MEFAPRSNAESHELHSIKTMQTLLKCNFLLSNSDPNFGRGVTPRHAFASCNYMQTESIFDM
jgi:hypothetical protein